jgi:GH25 family lysozyme M1 (1,4-beta-N-acetylmuramidase)
MTQTVNKAHGLDISKYQLSFSQAPNPPRPIQYITQRSGYAKKSDEKFIEFLPAMRESQNDFNTLIGQYHYYSTGVDVNAQIKFLQSQIAIAKSQGITVRYLWWDYEKFYNNLNRNSYNDLVYAMDKIPGETGLKTYMYCNEDVWNTALEPFGTAHRKMPFAYAAYYWYPTPNREPILPKNCDHYDWWQYEITGKYSVISTAGKGQDYGSGHANLDLSIYNGTLEKMYTDLGIEEEQPTPPPNTQIDITSELATIRQNLQIIENKVS